MMQGEHLNPSEKHLQGVLVLFGLLPGIYEEGLHTKFTFLFDREEQVLTAVGVRVAGTVGVLV
jgi:hypothetical protein